MDISNTGYRAGERECAFYPLWPLLMRWLSFLTGGNPFVAGLISANALSVAAWYAFYRIVAGHWGREAARLAVALLIVFPGSFCFQFIYSESLFLLLLMGLWWALDHGWQRVAWVMAFLLPLTRAIGVFCILPILWHVGTATSEPAQPQRCLPVSFALKVIRGWQLVIAPLCGWLWYLAIMFASTGNPFEGFAAQAFWDVNSVGNLWNVFRFIKEGFTPTVWHGYRGSVLDRAVFLLLAWCIPVLWRLDKRLLMWTCAVGIVPAMSASFTSFTRYAAVAFPMFIALAVTLNRTKYRWTRWLLIGVFGVLHALLVWRFVNFRWAG